MPGMSDRDHFAAAALTGLLTSDDVGEESNACGQAICQSAYLWADAMLRERCRAGGDCPGQDNAQNHDAAPAATASLPTADHAVCRQCRGRESGCGTGDTQEIAAYARFVGQVMHWISEATSAYASACSSDGGRKIMAQACSQCWDAFDRIAYPTHHDAAPAATADSPDERPLHAVSAGGNSSAASRDGGTGDTQEPVAWGVMQPNGEFAVLAFNRQRAEDYATASDRIVPLYRQHTLTDAQRAAVADAADRYAALTPESCETAATLRGLLKRLGGGE